MSMKPIIKWAGGKRRLLGEIKNMIPAEVLVSLTFGGRFYVEPFIGGAALLLDLVPYRARINDKNKELINMYRVVKNDHKRLINALRIHERNDSREWYDFVKSWDRQSWFTESSDWQRAARFIYLVKTCYGGIWRVNKEGKFNSTYNTQHDSIVNEPGIRALHDYLAGNDIDIRCGDYADALKDLPALPASTFVYLDPPYMPVNETASFTGYTADGFDYKEQERLRDQCVKLRDRGIPFIESNSDTPAVRELYKNFTIQTVQVRRDLAADPAKRGTVTELLITA